MASPLRLYEAVDALEIVRVWIADNEEQIIAAGGELPPELAELLDRVEGDLAAKAERVALYIRELLATASAVEEERKRLDARQQHYLKAADSLKRYLKAQLERAEIPKIEGKLVTVRVQRNPPALRCTITPEEFCSRHAYEHELVASVVEERTTYHFRTRGLLDAHKRGEQLPAEFTVEQRSHVRIV